MLNQDPNLPAQRVLPEGWRIWRDGADVRIRAPRRSWLATPIEEWFSPSQEWVVSDNLLEVRSRRRDQLEVRRYQGVELVIEADVHEFTAVAVESPPVESQPPVLFLTAPRLVGELVARCAGWGSHGCSSDWTTALVRSVLRGKAEAERVVPLLIAALAGAPWRGRLEAADALVRIGRPAVAALTAATRSEDAATRRMAALSLARIGTRALEGLAEAMHSDCAEVRAIATAALVRIGAAAVPPLILRLRAEPPIRALAASALSQIGAPAVPALIEEAESENTAIRRAVVGALGKIGDRRAASRVRGLAADPNDGIRQAAVEALGKLQDREAVPVLSACLRDDAPAIRGAAAAALGEIRDRAGVPPLASSLHDPEEGVRRGAAGALGRIASRDGIAPLCEALSDGAETVRCAAALALAEIAERDPAAALMNAIPLLKACLSQWRAAPPGAQQTYRAVLRTLERVTRGVRDLPLPVRREPLQPERFPIPALAEAPEPEELPIPARKKRKE